MQFYVGIHQPSDAWRFSHCMISINRLRKRKSDFRVNNWLMDSGAFTELNLHHYYRFDPSVYAAAINRWKVCGNLQAASSEDFMCEPFILYKTGLTVEDHQRLTIERYDAILSMVDEAYVLPVLQGYQPLEYVDHIRQYGERLKYGAWVGVGSVCKRNSNANTIEYVLSAIKAERPDLRLHGFGIKTTALKSALVQEYLYSSDSMAWSFRARKEGRNGNSWLEAQSFVESIADIKPDLSTIRMEIAY